MRHLAQSPGSHQQRFEIDLDVSLLPSDEEWDVAYRKRLVSGNNEKVLDAILNVDDLITWDCLAAMPVGQWLHDHSPNNDPLVAFDVIRNATPYHPTIVIRIRDDNFAMRVKLTWC